MKPSLDWLSLLWERPAIVAFMGILVTLLLYVLSRRDRMLQRRRAYVDLEFEASRLFRVCIDHPDIMTYLEADSETLTPMAREKAYWHVCQILNIFEVIISFYRDKLVAADLFSTWVAWFHELGTARRFGEFWEQERLKFHYKIDVQLIMNAARRLYRARLPDFDDDQYDRELLEFYRQVACIFEDSAILEHFTSSLNKTAE
jgi:hypothetical protein